MPVAKGKLFWSYLNTLDTKYEPLWKVTWVGDAKEAKKLKALGLKPKLVDEVADGEEMAEAGTHKYKFVRYEKKRGKGVGKNKKPKCAIQVDGEKDWFTGIIGNGSEGLIEYGIYEWEYKGGSGKSADLKGVVITKLLEYEAPESDDEEEEESELFGDMDSPEPETDSDDSEDTSEDKEEEDDDDY